MAGALAAAARRAEGLQVLQPIVRAFSGPLGDPFWGRGAAHLGDPFWGRGAPRRPFLGPGAPRRAFSGPRRPSAPLFGGVAPLGAPFWGSCRVCDIDERLCDRGRHDEGPAKQGSVYRLKGGDI